LTGAPASEMIGWRVRATHRPRLLFAVLVAELALTVPLPSQARGSAARIEDVESSLARDRSYKVRVDAALVLGRLRQTRSIPALIGALRDPHQAVRASAALALGRIGSPIARDAVAKAAQDPSLLVRRMALGALKRLGGQAPPPAEPAPPRAPAIRPRPGRKLTFEVKAMGDTSRRAGPALRSHMRDVVLDQLRPFGDVAAREHEGMFAIDGVIKDLSTATRDGDVQVSCAVQLVLSRQPGGGVFLLTSGEATVQKPRRQFNPRLKPGMELEALETAVRAASEDLVRQLERE
jgi:HEAT repeat protein